MTTHNHDAGNEKPARTKASRKRDEFPPVPGSVPPEVEQLYAERREAEADSDSERVSEIDRKLAEFENRNK